MLIQSHSPHRVLLCPHTSLKGVLYKLPSYMVKSTDPLGSKRQTIGHAGLHGQAPPLLKALGADP